MLRRERIRSEALHLRGTKSTLRTTGAREATCSLSSTSTRPFFPFFNYLNARLMAKWRYLFEKSVFRREEYRATIRFETKYSTKVLAGRIFRFACVSSSGVSAAPTRSILRPSRTSSRYARPVITPQARQPDRHRLSLAEKCAKYEWHPYACRRASDGMEALCGDLIQ